eukprot:TRINITY_DN491_c0_g1_i3.p1 TRINITY_DN491_c0_g1~~TRINITY_DN491_c0_g1_i3.p1  ORF type:complete len:380 (-),score=89.34 TRINITY_DN491_c0_g1_i3:107-1246(-)
MQNPTDTASQVSNHLSPQKPVEPVQKEVHAEPAKKEVHVEPVQKEVHVEPVQKAVPDVPKEQLQKNDPQQSSESNKQKEDTSEKIIQKDQHNLVSSETLNQPTTEKEENKSALKFSILGCGNIGDAIARGIDRSNIAPKKYITVTRRDKNSLESYREEGFNVTTNNVEAVMKSKVVFVCVQPKQLNDLLAEIKEVSKDKIIISVVSGASIKEIQAALGDFSLDVIRAMPNTAIAYRESMTCIAGSTKSSPGLQLTEQIFQSLGSTLIVEESQIVPATALCACGIAFFARAIRAASQGGIEIGFHSEQAIKLAAQTARGAATLLLQTGNHPEREVDKVTTPMGCTIAGLNQMEHNGFSSAFIKGIVTSAEKAAILYKKNN